MESGVKIHSCCLSALTVLTQKAQWSGFVGADSSVYSSVAECMLGLSQRFSGQVGGQSLGPGETLAGHCSQCG